jgi:hypothetical protein
MAETSTNLISADTAGARPPWPPLSKVTWFSACRLFVWVVCTSFSASPSEPEAGRLAWTTGKR